MLRFAYSTINWGDTCDLTAALAEIRKAGWGGVELFGHTLDWLGSREKLIARLDGLAAAALFGSIELPTSAQQLTIHQHRIDYAAALGARAYGLVGGSRLPWRPPLGEEYADLARFCEQLAAYGATRGVTVAYHPHVDCTIETEDEIDWLLNQTSALRLCLDASHIALVGESPVAHLRKYRERLGYVHLKDWARGKFVELGRGTIGVDVPAILRELEEQSFAGWIVVEQSRSVISPSHSAWINAEYLAGLGYRIR
jgi:inosose dehydratase